MERRIYFDSGTGEGCGGKCGGKCASRNQSSGVAKGEKGETGKQGPQGPPGPGADIKAVRLGAGPAFADAAGADDAAVNADAVTALKNDGFDLTQSSTLRAAVNNSDPTKIVVSARLSNRLIKYLGSFPARLFKKGGKEGMVPVKNSDNDFDWSWQYLSTVVKNAYLSSSASSNSFGLGSKSFTIEKDLAYYPNMVCAATDVSNPDNLTNHMTGIVTSYNPTSGVLIIDVKAFVGTGSSANWKLNVGYTPFLPAMAGQSGKYLTNNGSEPNWGYPPTNQIGDLVPSLATTRAGSIYCNGDEQIWNPDEPNSPENPYRNLVEAIGANNPSSPFFVATNKFKVPDYRGRAFIGANGSLTITALNTVGGVGGEELVTLTKEQSGVPDHEVNLPGNLIINPTDNPFQGTDELDDSGMKIRRLDYQEVKGSVTGADAEEGHNNIPPSVACNVFIVYR